MGAGLAKRASCRFFRDHVRFQLACAYKSLTCIQLLLSTAPSHSSFLSLFYRCSVMSRPQCPNSWIVLVGCVPNLALWHRYDVTALDNAVPHFYMVLLSDNSTLLSREMTTFELRSQAPTHPSTHTLTPAPCASTHWVYCPNRPVRAWHHTAQGSWCELIIVHHTPPLPPPFLPTPLTY